MLCYYDDPKPPSPLGWWDDDYDDYENDDYGTVVT